MIATARARELTQRARRTLGLAGDPRQPSRALFRGIRRKLTLWYGAVLAAALILSGVVLYLAVQQSLLGPMNSQLSVEAQTASVLWDDNWIGNLSAPLAINPCPHQYTIHLDPNLLIACYDTKGRLEGENSLLYANSRQLATFNDPSLAVAAAHGGATGDTISTAADGEFASVQRYALPVRVPSGTIIPPGQNGACPAGSKVDQGQCALSRPYPLGVIVVGLPVGGQANALSTLLNLLLLLGGLTLLLSLGAGLFLANRALHPARIAYARQRDFIADASHELRTPLTMLRSSVEFVLRGKDHLPPDDVALLEDTVQETTHLTSLANNMLNLARLDSDDVHVDEEVIDLSHLATEVTRWAQPLANERHISLNIHTPESALVLGDRPLLEQAVLVLVDNAIKYNRADGSVEVRVVSNQTTALVSVTDTGIGVAPEDLKRMGERFYRVDKARSRESGGAGLGLSIVRSILSRHGGQLSLESEPGTGTRATISLPIVGSLNGR